jgi:hypothetical protein
LLSRASGENKNKNQPHANEIFLDARGMVNKVWLFGYSIGGSKFNIFYSLIGSGNKLSNN